MDLKIGVGVQLALSLIYMYSKKLPELYIGS